MRKFALYRDPPDFDDDLGDCLPLNGPHVYMVGPAGLGLNINPQTAGFDNFFYKKIKKSSFDPETVSGTIIFYDEDVPKNAYLYYRQFVSFCTHAKKLYFGYAPLANDDPDDLSETFVTYAANGITIRSSVSDLVSFEGDGIYVAGGTHQFSQESTIYKADTEFVSIDKGEIDLYGTLQCPVQFTLLTPWYDLTHKEIDFSDVFQGEATFSHTEPIGLVRGDTYGSCDIELDINCTNAQFSILDDNSTIFSFNSYNYPEIFEVTPALRSVSGKISYSSVPNDCHFTYDKEVSPGVYEHFNLLDYMDITEDIFPEIKVGSNVSVYVYLVDIGQVDKVSAELFDYYRSV